jgi:hypothetical protein
VPTFEKKGYGHKGKIPPDRSRTKLSLPEAYVFILFADRYRGTGLSKPDRRRHVARWVGGAMNRRNEEQTQSTSSVSLRVPDFAGEDGVTYTDIEVVVEMDGDIRDTVQLVKTLERPLTECK